MGKAEARLIETQTNLQELAEFVVARARLSGATDAEVTIRQGDEFSTTVRLRLRRWRRIRGW
jgi:hypothetical protein